MLPLNHYDFLTVANGDIPNSDILRIYTGQTENFLCLDGASDRLREAGFSPDAVMGDMDSIREQARGIRSIPLPDQDGSDLDKSLEWAHEQGWKTGLICGLFGGRRDHELMNMTLLTHWGSILELSFFDDRSMGHLLNPGRHIISMTENELFSVIPVSEVEDISISGGIFELKHANLDRPSRGLSNRSAGDLLTLEFISGSLLFIRPEYRHHAY